MYIGMSRDMHEHTRMYGCIGIAKGFGKVKSLE